MCVAVHVRAILKQLTRCEVMERSLRVGALKDDALFVPGDSGSKGLPVWNGLFFALKGHEWHSWDMLHRLHRDVLLSLNESCACGIYIAFGFVMSLLRGIGVVQRAI